MHGKKRKIGKATEACPVCTVTFCEKPAKRSKEYNRLWKKDRRVMVEFTISSKSSLKLKELESLKGGVDFKWNGPKLASKLTRSLRLYTNL